MAKRTGPGSGKPCTTETDIPLPKPAEGTKRQPYTSELAETVLKSISTGTSLRKTCQALDLQSACVWEWIRDDIDGFSSRYTRARELQAEAWADEIKELSDECREGTVVTEEIDPKGKVHRKVVVSDMVERTRLQIEARKWLLSKLHHKKFGDRLDLTNADGGSINVTIVRGETIEDMKRAVLVTATPVPALPD